MASGRVELTFDEAYYALWSQHLAWGYHDHPPMVAAWIRASTTLFGVSDWGMRALGWLAFALAPALIAAIAWRAFGSARAAAFAALLWVSMPLVAATPIATPDGPLVFFWALATACLVEIWRGRKAGWLGLGLVGGLAFLSKFTAFFLGGGLGLALIVTPSLRRWFVSPLPYLASLLALALFAPFVVWNSAHGWETFAMQFQRVPAHAFRPGYLLELTGSQLLLGNPFVFAAAALGIASGLKAPDGEAPRLLAATIAPLILYFFVHALHDRVQGNWPAPLYPAIAILAGHAAAQGGWAERLARLAPPLGLGLVALAFLHVATAYPPPGPTDPLARIGGWRALASEVGARAAQEHAAFLVTEGYASTSLLRWYGRDLPPVVEGEDSVRWTQEPPADKALFAQPGLAFADAKDHYETTLARHFREVEEVGALDREVGGRKVGAYVLFRVSGLRDDPAKW